MTKEQHAVQFLSDLIKGSMFENKSYIAGGFVRDEILSLYPKDIDIVVELPNGGIEFANFIAEKMGNYKEGSNPVIYPTFGTAKVVLKGKYKGIDISGIEVESVMTRSEEYIRGSRKPIVKEGTLQDDVLRRDFTVNSLLKNLSTMEVLDLTGHGWDDIEAGIIRTTSNPEIIFIDDPLRMLRAFRFSAKYNWVIEDKTFEYIQEFAKEIENISKERVQEELVKTLLTKNPKQAFVQIYQSGLLKYVLPELHECVGVTQNEYHDEDVFNHILTVVEKTSENKITRLGALFHDIGKPKTKTVNDGKVHFYGHELVGGTIAENAMKRLKFSNEDIDAVKSLVNNHMRLKQTGSYGELASDKMLRKFKRELGNLLNPMLNIMDSDNNSHSEKSDLENQIDHIQRRLEVFDAPQELTKLPIDGNDLILHLNIKPSPLFKEILAKVQDAVDENPNLTKIQALQIARGCLK